MIDIEHLAWDRTGLAREYRLERVLGEEDGLVRVLAQDLRLDRAVLLVMLAPDQRTTARAEAFVASIRLLARVGHPGVRSVHRADAFGDFAYAALEHVPGEPLAEHLASGPVPVGEAIRYGLELLAALEASRARGVAHPQLSPDTVVRQPGRLVLDGIGAAPADSSTERTGLVLVSRVIYQAVTGRRWEAAGTSREALAAVPLRLRPALRCALAPDPHAASFRRRLTLASGPIRVAGLALLALTVLTLTGAAAWHWLRRPPGPPSNEIAVLPLEAIGGPAGDSLGTAMAHLLSLTLSDVSGLHMTSPRRIARWAAQTGYDAGGIQNQAPRDLGVQWVAHGQARRSGDRVRVGLTLYSWRGAKEYVEVTGTVADLVGLTERLSLPVLNIVAPELEPRVGELRDFAGVPFEALKSFLQGEAAYDRDEWTLAEQRYEAAIDADSTFALARWRLANVRHWERRPYDYLGDLRELDGRLGDRLRPTDRAVVKAFLEPDVDRRLRRLDSVVSHARPDAYLQYLYAHELFHRGPLVGRDIELAIRGMRETIALDSSFADPYNHIFAADLRAGRKEHAQYTLALRQAIEVKSWPGDLDKVRLMKLAYDERFRPWRGRLARWWLERTGDSATLAGVSQVARLGAPWFDIPGAQIGLCRILLDRESSTDSARASARNGIAIGLLALGRTSEALAQLDSSIADWPSPEVRLQRAEWEVIPRLVGLSVIPASAPRWREPLEQMLADTTTARLETRIRWALALGHVASGDTAAARGQATRLEQLAPGSPLGVLLRAVIAGKGGDLSRALDVSDSVRGAVSVNQPPDPFAGAVYHLLRADWHMARGNVAAAERDLRWIDGSDFEGWPVGAPQAGEIDAALGTYVRWRRGEALLTSGATAADTVAGCATLRRVVELWSGSEADMRPLQAAAVARAGGRACAA